MRYKTDWPAARERWIALWEGRSTDRPCISVTAPKRKRIELPPPETAEQIWLDPDYVVRTLRATMESTYYGGDSFPSYLLMAGWVANTYGATPRFKANTIWFEPVTVDWDNPPSFPLDLNSPWLRKVEAVHQAALAEAGRDDFLIGNPCILPGNDMVPLVTGSDAFLFGLKDHPEWVRAAIGQLARNWIALVRRFQKRTEQTHEFWYGNAGWMPYWAPEPFVYTQSDISCMLSPAMYEEFVQPELDLLGGEFKHVWYHLDGAVAFQHVPRLCSLPYLKVIQFTAGDGSPPNGPHDLDLYRKIQAAGKIVHISVPCRNIEPLVRKLDPRLLCIDAWCESAGEADELIRSATRWTRGI